jgi:hypothetical protein
MSNIFSTFPSTYSIPPACFYNIQGLSTWLNQHPEYKQYFINRPNMFPNLYAMTSSLSTIQYDPANVPLSPLVTTLSQDQSRIYTEQIKLFRKVYEFNSNAYVNSLDTLEAPIYYNFSSYKELSYYKASVGLINKLYSFDAMANGKNTDGATLNWIVPFPL